MLTDNELTRELGEAFRSATTNLTYTGRTRPPRGIRMALPAVAVGTAATVVAICVNVGGSHDPDVSSTAGRHPSAVATSKLVTKTLRLAGFTITYKSAAGDPGSVFAEVGITSLPGGVREIQLTETKDRAWVGKDPATGDNALYIKTTAGDGDQLFALLSPTWSQHQLIDLLEHGQPQVVPAVSASPSGG